MKPPREDLALRKPATQSSISQWSRGKTLEADARGANDGQISGEQGFHTGYDLDPFWEVDLERDYVVERVVLYNRRECAFRLQHFRILKSRDRKRWRTIYAKRDSSVFGATKIEPHVADIEDFHVARYVRVQIDGQAWLHFNECQVFGREPTPKELDGLAEKQAELEASVVDGRDGYFAPVGNLEVFVDRKRYSPKMLNAIQSDFYEVRERNLVRNLVRPGDRVLEIGTAIGAVAMTAAAIVGGENVLTFDANPAMVEDARKNFLWNGLAAIKAQNGVLTNRNGFVAGKRASFGISADFWASRLGATSAEPDIVEVREIPISCLEDEVRAHGANVLICDIEGGEVPLLTNADLSSFRLLIVETHAWLAGEAATDAMVRALVLSGFNVDLVNTGQQMLVMRR